MEKWAHSIDVERRWIPADVETAEECALEAAYEWDHEFLHQDDIRDVVLVGETDWWMPEDYAGLIDADDIIDLLNERIYDNVWEEAEFLHNCTTEEQRQRLDKDLQSLLAEWFQDIDYSDYFQVKDHEIFEVTRYADEDGGPEVQRIEED